MVGISEPNHPLVLLLGTSEGRPVQQMIIDLGCVRIYVHTGWFNCKTFTSETLQVTSVHGHNHILTLAMVTLTVHDRILNLTVAVTGQQGTDALWGVDVDNLAWIFLHALEQ